MSKRKVVVVLTLLFYALVIIITLHMNGVNSIKELLTNGVALEKVNYIIQIITGIGLLIGAIIGVWQYYLSTKCETIKQEKESVEKAIDLADWYRINILGTYEALHYVYVETGMLEIIKGINKDKMVNFDQYELNELLSESQIKKIEEINKSKELIDALMKVEVSLGMDLGIKKHVDVNKEEKSIILNAPAIFRKYNNAMVSDLLNRLEVFAMYFEHNAADESVVYQSLHQTYLDIVQMLYYEIAYKNATGHKKFYTNIIDLYNKWYKRFKNQKDENVKKSRREVAKGTIVEKID